MTRCFCVVTWASVTQCDPSLQPVMNVTLVTCDGAGACGDQWPVPRPRAPAPLTLQAKCDHQSGRGRGLRHLSVTMTLMYAIS